MGGYGAKVTFYLGVMRPSGRFGQIQNFLGGALVAGCSSAHLPLNWFLTILTIIPLL